MINLEDSLRYSNVISCKYRIHYEKLEKVLKGFVEDVLKLGLTPKVRYFILLLIYRLMKLFIRKFSCL